MKGHRHVREAEMAVALGEPLQARVNMGALDQGVGLAEAADEKAVEDRQRRRGNGRVPAAPWRD